MRWLHTDERGSIIATTDNTGAATPYTYGPYGEPGGGSWSGSRYRYTGQIALPEVQLSAPPAASRREQARTHARSPARAPPAKAPSAS